MSFFFDWHDTQKEQAGELDRLLSDPMIIALVSSRAHKRSARTPKVHVSCAGHKSGAWLSFSVSENRVSFQYGGLEQFGIKGFALASPMLHICPNCERRTSRDALSVIQESLSALANSQFAPQVKF